MRDDENKDEGIPARTEDRYEAIASQQEIYLEEVEEAIRITLHARRSDGCESVS